ncbi:MAG TPA: protein kinase [Vicinamibacterales bacterium]|nr:protein kinase [Vicinamibacterales bacterium]
MSVSPGTRIGVYEITAKVGQGGMGEVYRARDTRLGRDVAVKLLPPDMAADSERLARFEREAKTLAALNHPHIAHLYGFETAAETSALVMELVEGEDLAERLKRGPMPLEDALPVARQIAEALEAAHDAGIIHRDLKPANIKLRPDGTIKVLDFGLAKAIEPATSAGSAANSADSPTITSPAVTQRGMILGTAAYMAPEQAKGKPVDRRADIWAFGCVLYEMLTGRRTFEGEDISDTLVSVLRDSPRWQALPADTPPHVRALLRRCLQKDPQKRLPHIGPARLDLTEGAPPETSSTAPPSPSRWRSLAMGVTIGAVLAASAAFAVWPEPAAPTPAVEFAIEAPAGHTFPGGNRVPRFAVSPDGRFVVYQTEDRKQSQLRVRALGSLDERVLPGLESPASGSTTQQAFWSPDSRWLAYFDEVAGQLKKVPAEGGPIQVIASIPGNQLSGSWNDDNVILMASLGTRGIQRVSGDGGAVTQVTNVDESAGELNHLWPQFLPDGRHFVYFVVHSGDRSSALHMAALDGGPGTKLIESLAAAHPLWPDRLLFVTDGALLSQQLDVTSRRLIGEPEQVSERVSFTQGGRLGVSASRTGVIVRGDGALDDAQETVWLDRQGHETANAPPSVAVGRASVRLSPDGRRLVFGRTGGGRTGQIVNELWMQDVERGIEARIATVAPETTIVFSHDSRRIAYRQVEPSSIVEQDAAGATPAVDVFKLGGNQLAVFPLDWSPDGRHLLIARGGVDRGLWVIPFGGDQTPNPYSTGLVPRGGATFSPDGKYIAYAQGAGVETQVFMQPFPDARGGRWVMSPPGGAFPRWRRDGRELYYIGSDGWLMAVPVTTSSAVEVGKPTRLFQVPGFASSFPYDVAADGQRFVTLRPRLDALRNQRLIVTTSWQPKASQR